MWNELITNDEKEKVKTILAIDGKTQRGNGAIDLINAGIDLSVVEKQLELNYEMAKKLKSMNKQMKTEDLDTLKYNEKEISKKVKAAYDEKHPEESKKQSKGCP